jgi:hypothetical protein
MSLMPPPALHQPSDVSPAWAWVTEPVALHVEDRNLYFTASFMPFCAASVITWAQGVPVDAMKKKSGSNADTVVI